jgi:TNF receptor-associated protein 1
VSQEKAGTFTISDTGIGMTRSELIDNLGTIARSGSKAFISELEGADTTSAKTNIIGQFGVGFYSTFMVGNEVTVYSKSATDEPAHVWKSDGSGKFTIAEATGVARGTKIVVQLNDECKKFASENTVQEILEKHSNFVSYPIFVNGNRMNTVEALWTQQPSTVRFLVSSRPASQPCCEGHAQ